MLKKTLLAATMAAATVTAASAELVGPWKLYDVNGAFYSDLYIDTAASNNKYLAFRSTTAELYIYVDPAIGNAGGDAGPFEGYWVTYADDPGFTCGADFPAVDDLGISHDAWGYIDAFTSPDGVNLGFDGSYCDGELEPWMATDD